MANKDQITMELLVKAEEASERLRKRFMKLDQFCRRIKGFDWERFEEINEKENSHDQRHN